MTNPTKRGRKPSPDIAAKVAAINALPADGSAAYETLASGVERYQAGLTVAYLIKLAEKTAGDGRKFTRTVAAVPEGWLVSIRRVTDKPLTHQHVDKAAWGYVKALPQGDVFKALCAIAKGGEPLTHKRLSELTGYHPNRISHWLTAGSAQEPMADSIRHHLWLAVKHGKPI